MSDDRIQDRPVTAALGATVALSALIGYLTLAPIHDTGVPGSDTIHHFIAFAALAFPLSLSRLRLVPWVVLLAIAYGGVIELIQPLVGRDREFLDLVADAVGAAIGGGIGASVWCLRGWLT